MYFPRAQSLDYIFFCEVFSQKLKICLRDYAFWVPLAAGTSSHNLVSTFKLSTVPTYRVSDTKYRFSDPPQTVQCSVTRGTVGVQVYFIYPIYTDSDSDSPLRMLKL